MPDGRWRSSYDAWKTRSPEDEDDRYRVFDGPEGPEFEGEEPPADEEPCPACGGEGRDLVLGIVYEPGCGHPHMGEVDRGPCDVCRGSGSVPAPLVELDLYDLDERAPPVGV